MKINKSPGSDGLTVEFYRLFWEDVQNLVINSLNEGFDLQKLSDSQKHGIITLSFKKGNKNHLNNWRPITLLNTDYKILTHILAQRLQTVLPKIISTDQNGYLKNRFIGYSVRQIEDIIELTKNDNKQNALLFVDFKKAFDSIEWNFMNKTLSKFGFHNNTIRWINTLYNQITSCVLNNGWKTEFVSPQRGIRQGCPCSALIYIVTAEILAIILRNQRKGINIPNTSKNIKITQLADDTTLFLNNEEDITKSLNILEEFGTLSGLKINKDKTKGMWLGKRNNENNYQDISFDNDVIKSLGVFFFTKNKVLK